jgi:hypothetical protein
MMDDEIALELLAAARECANKIGRDPKLPDVIPPMLSAQSFTMLAMAVAYAFSRRWVETASYSFNDQNQPCVSFQTTSRGERALETARRRKAASTKPTDKDEPR